MDIYFLKFYVIINISGVDIAISISMSIFHFFSVNNRFKIPTTTAAFLDDGDVTVGATDSQLAVARLGGFPLNIEACSRRASAGVSPRRLP